MTAELASAQPRALPPPIRRTLALVAFAGRTVSSGWAWRASVLYAWAAAIGYLGLAASWSVRGHGVSGTALVARALVWISWAGGTAAWVAARNVEEDEGRLGLTALAALRGASPRGFFVARTLATVLLLTRAVGLPALLLWFGLAVLGRASEGDKVSVSVAAAVVVYSLVFGIAFGGVARLSSRISPRHSRIVFLALVLGPEILRGVVGDIPTLVSGFADLVDLLIGTGGA